MTVRNRGYNWSASVPYKDELGTSLSFLVGGVVSGSLSGVDSPKGRPRVFTENKYDTNISTIRYGNYSGRLRYITPQTPNGLTRIYDTQPVVWDLGNRLDNNDMIRLMAKLVAQVRTHEFNAAVFLAEGKESLETIGSLAKRIGQAGFALRRGDFRSAARSLATSDRKLNARKSLHDNWLELQYGWMPMLKDIQSAAEYFAHVSNKPMRRIYRARVERKSVSLDSQHPSLSQLGEAVRTINAKLINTEDYQVQSAASLGFLDPEVVAWELVPYSFVADWFIPIGNYLETRAHVSRLNGLVVISRKELDRYTLLNQDYGSDFQPRFGGGGATQVKVSMSRSVEIPSVPLPVFKPLKKALSYQHALNGLALVSAAFR